MPTNITQRPHLSVCCCFQSFWFTLAKLPHRFHQGSGQGSMLVLSVRYKRDLAATKTSSSSFAYITCLTIITYLSCQVLTHCLVNL